MPGICYDQYGNIGLAFNVASSVTNIYPGIRYTGRKECDPLNTMTYAEGTLIAGAAANGSARYGDYSHLVCDPDGIRFWFTAEWNNATTWNTRISAFTLDQCGFVPPFVCNPPASMSVSSVTTTSANLAWQSGNGAISYDVDYAVQGSNVWTPAASATTATSVLVTGLNPATAYDWRVRTNCEGSQSSYARSQFTTMSLTCADPYEPNNTLASSVGIPVNSDVFAKIGSAGDKDYFSFNNSASQMKIKITLSSLPADYDLKLYGPNDKEVKHSDHGGTADEVLVYNSKKVGTFKVYVHAHHNNVFNASDCYNLNVLLSAQNFSSDEPDETDRPEMVKDVLNIYPIPAKDAVSIGFIPLILRV
jgi:chitodextrinase